MVHVYKLASYAAFEERWRRFLCLREEEGEPAEALSGMGDGALADDFFLRLRRETVAPSSVWMTVVVIVSTVFLVTLPGDEAEEAGEAGALAASAAAAAAAAAAALRLRWPRWWRRRVDDVDSTSDSAEASTDEAPAPERWLR